MIAIDTNVLLRYLLTDDEQQYAKARNLIATRSPVLITDVVLVETIWTLTGKRYQLDKAAICKVVRSLIEDTAFEFENVTIVWWALNDYENAEVIQGKKLDFADALIVNKATHTAMTSGKKLEGFYSFDKAITQHYGAKTPE